MAWHPSVATQIVVAYEDDNNPVMQLWDLRQTVSYVHEFQGHHKVCPVSGNSAQHCLTIGTGGKHAPRGEDPPPCSQQVCCTDANGLQKAPRSWRFFTI